jgi:hypothetical protein
VPIFVVVKDAGKYELWIDKVKLSASKP